MAGGKELKLAISIGGKIDKSLGSAINNAQSQLNSIGSGVEKVARAVTIATAAAGVKLVHDSVEAYTTYESALSKTAATAGVEKGSAAYDQLNEAAREAGRTTVKTAQESAEALGYMALAGWSVEDSAKGLMPILKLSASTNTELATTSDLVTDSMANLGLGINDLNRYLDVSVAANNKSNQSATQLMEAYLGVGGVLNNLNSPIEESAAILGVLANRGTKGSEAGTALNAILVNMQKKSGDAHKAMTQLGISMYDQSGNARRLTDVFQDISNKTSGMTEQQRNLMYQMIGGKSHLDSFAKIMQGFTTQTEDGTMEVYALQRAFADSGGSLDKFYDTYTNTVEGSKAAMESAFDGMKINLGEKLAPTVSEFYGNLTDNMPEIESVIMNFAERTIPVAGKAIDFLANNGDKVVSTAIAISKAFIRFKLASGTIKSIDSTAKLFKSIAAIGKSAGAAKTIGGIFGALTGTSGMAATTAATAGATTAVSTFGTTVASVFGTVAATTAPAAVGLAAVVTALIAADKISHKSNYHFADDMNKGLDTVLEKAKPLTEYVDNMNELNKIKLTLENPESTAEQLSAAQQKLQEIAELCGVEYKVKIDTEGNITGAEETVQNIADSYNGDIAPASRDTYRAALDSINDFTNPKNIQKYKNNAKAIDVNTESLAAYKKQVEACTEGLNIYNRAADNFDSGFIDSATYNQQAAAAMEKIMGAGKSYSNLYADWNDSQLTVAYKNFFGEVVSGMMLGANLEMPKIESELENNKYAVEEYEKASAKAKQALVDLLATDIHFGDAGNIAADVQLFENYGRAIKEIGHSTDGVAVAYATAKAGYTDFAAAISDGKAQEMAQSFIAYKQSIGETAENAIQGAALIKNGFADVAAATAAGGTAVNAVLNDIRSLGDMSGIFDGLDTSGIESKLTSIAQSMGLIPDNKVVTITADGDIKVTDILGTNQGPIQVPVTVEPKVNKTSFNLNTAFGANTFAPKAINVTANTANASSEIQSVTNAANKIPKEHDTKITVSGNAKSTVQSINTAISNLPNSKTITINVEQKGKIPNSAKGSDNWRGGLTYLNDQNGVSDPREVIEYKGSRYYYNGRDVLTNVPRGARIYTAAESRPMIDGSHRNGLERVPFDGYIAELHKNEQVLTEAEADDYRSGGVFSQAIDRLRHTRSESGGKSDGDGEGDGVVIHYNPTIVIEGDGDETAVNKAMRENYEQFVEFMERWERDRRRKSFSAA